MDVVVPTFKCVLVGNGCTGKTTFMHRHLTGEFESRYVATCTPAIHPLVFYTNKGAIQFDVWDTPGQQGFRGEDDYYANAQCAIIMVDLARMSFLPNWQFELVQSCGNIPIVICGNDVDGTNTTATPLRVVYNQEPLQYFNVSVKRSTNCVKPFIWLTRKLLGNRNLRFIKMPRPLPPMGIVVPLLVQERYPPPLDAVRDEDEDV